MHKDKNQPSDIKPDLKHDNMEYAASADGDDILDADINEDDGITAEELAIIDNASPDEQAAALNSAELDRQSDNDVIFDVNDNEEDYDDEDDNEEEDETIRSSK